MLTSLPHIAFLFNCLTRQQEWVKPQGSIIHLPFNLSMDENLHADKCKNTQINTHFVEHKKDLHVCWQWRTEGATWRVNVEAHSSFLQTGTLEKRKNIIIYFLLLSLSLTQHKIINWGFLLWWFLWLILKRSGETDGLRAELDNWRILHLFCKKRKSLKLALLRRGSTIVTRHAKDKDLCETQLTPSLLIQTTITTR